MNAGHVFIVAVENSSDQLGAGLVEALRALSPDIKIRGVGGAAMAHSGVDSLVDIEGLSILGFTEALRVYPLVLKRVKQTVDAILTDPPDAVVLIDSWGFMIRVSQRLKRAGYSGQIVKYVAPQVWAMREGRAKILARSNDHVLSIHSFDAPYFEKHGLAVTHVGNPMFDTDFASGDADSLRRELNLRPEQKVCAVLFGSRQSELAQLRAPMIAAVKILRQHYPDLIFVSPVSESLKNYISDKSNIEDIHLLAENRKFDVFAAADVAIACSGTVTTQLASVGIPTVVTYRLKTLTWWVAKKLYKPRFVSLINISAGKALMPEFLQEQATGENLARSVSQFLENDKLHAQRSAELVHQASIMRGKNGSASESAARKIIELIAS